MSIFSVCGVAILCVVIALCFKHIKSTFAIFITFFSCIILLKYAIDILSTNFSFLTSLFSKSPFGDYSGVIYKTLGVSMIVQTTSDICKDAGESALASKVELIGKCEIMILCIPLIQKILEITKEIIV